MDHIGLLQVETKVLLESLGLALPFDPLRPTTHKLKRDSTMPIPKYALEKAMGLSAQQFNSFYNCILKNQIPLRLNYFTT